MKNLAGAMNRKRKLSSLNLHMNASQMFANVSQMFAKVCSTGGHKKPKPKAYAIRIYACPPRCTPKSGCQSTA